VIVVVAGFMTTGSVLGALLGREGRKRRRRRRDNASESVASGDQGVPSLASGHTDVLKTSVQALVEAGRRADMEADAARADTRQAQAETRAAWAETRALRQRLEVALNDRAEALRARDRAIAELDRCDTKVRELQAELDGGKA
jgi:F0F1-type ATP synthase epsilon subunit